MNSPIKVEMTKAQAALVRRAIWRLIIESDNPNNLDPITTRQCDALHEVLNQLPDKDRPKSKYRNEELCRNQK